MSRGTNILVKSQNPNPPKGFTVRPLSVLTEKPYVLDAARVMLKELEEKCRLTGDIPPANQLVCLGYKTEAEGPHVAYYAQLEVGLRPVLKAFGLCYRVRAVWTGPMPGEGIGINEWR